MPQDVELLKYQLLISPPFSFSDELLNQLTCPSFLHERSLVVSASNKDDRCNEPKQVKDRAYVASIPLWVHGLSFNTILSLNASDS